MRISDWSSDVCSSDLIRSRLQGCKPRQRKHQRCRCSERPRPATFERPAAPARADFEGRPERTERTPERPARAPRPRGAPEAGMETYRIAVGSAHDVKPRSEEHTSELQSLMRTSYAVFCLKKKTKTS